MITPVMRDSESELPELLSAVDFIAATGNAFRSDDPRVEPLLAGASAAVRRYCGWHVAPRVIEQTTLDYEGGEVLVLPTLRLEKIEELALFGESVDLDKIRFSANGEVLIPNPRHVRLGEGFGGIEIKMQHGFDVEEVADLLSVIIQVTVNALSSPMGATQERAGQVSTVWAQTAPGVSGGLSLLERDQRILDSYRLPGGA